MVASSRQSALWLRPQYDPNPFTPRGVLRCGYFTQYRAIRVTSLVNSGANRGAANYDLGIECSSRPKGISTMHPKCSLIVLSALATLAASSYAGAQDQPFDVLITHGHVVDGTGSPWYSGDVGIRGGRIAAIGNLTGRAAKRTIDVHGEVVAPGFIDMLGQSELTILVEPRLPSKIFQGITTEITGEGNSIAPLNDSIIANDRPGYEHYKIKPDWRTMREYFARIEKQGMGINLASYVGATQVRRMVLGDADVQPTAAQIGQMRSLVEQAMRDGAVGVSTSLQYAPAPYAKTEELIALASAAAPLGGIYATHMRSEGDAVLDSIDEAARIGREAHVPVEIWHLKAAGKSNWGRMPQIVAKINQLRAEGVDISADTYAYTAWFNEFSAFIPPWAHDGGVEKLIERMKDPPTRARIRKDMTTPSASWDNEWDEVPGPEAIQIAVVQNPELLPLQGKRLSEIAAEWKTRSTRSATFSSRTMPRRTPPSSAWTSGMFRWR